MVTGRSPFQGSHALDVARRVTDLVPPPLHEQNAQIPLFLSDTVSRLLEKDPAWRYQTAAEVHELLLGHLAKLHQGSSAEAIAAPSLAQPRKRRFRHWGKVAAAAVLLVAVGAALGLGWRWLKPTHPSVPDTGGQGPVEDRKGEPAPEVLTVAQAGAADFDSLREAIARAGPGTVIRILDSAVYRGRLSIGDDRLRGLTIESTAHATLENSDGAHPTVFIGQPGVVLRGLQIRALDRQHAISVLGFCEGLTLESLKIVQPATSPYAAIALWPGTRGSEERPVVLRGLDVQGGTMGIAVLGKAGAPTGWVRIEDCRLSGPGLHLTIESAVHDVAVTGNIFTIGRRGVGLELDAPRQARRLTIANNTFFKCTEWLGLGESSFEQVDVAIANNLILQARSIQVGSQPISQAAAWFRDNWWEPVKETDFAQVNATAKLVKDVKLVSHDPASPDFLRPKSGTMPLADGKGGAPFAYVGALAPANTPNPCP
jgi:hypothetical protein